MHSVIYDSMCLFCERVLSQRAVIMPPAILAATTAAAQLEALKSRLPRDFATMSSQVLSLVHAQLLDRSFGLVLHE